jgi:ribosomal protein L39E
MVITIPKNEGEKMQVGTNVVFVDGVKDEKPGIIYSIIDQEKRRVELVYLDYDNKKNTRSPVWVFETADYDGKENPKTCTWHYPTG